MKKVVWHKFSITQPPPLGIPLWFYNPEEKQIYPGAYMKLSFDELQYTIGVNIQWAYIDQALEQLPEPPVI